MADPWRGHSRPVPVLTSFAPIAARIFLIPTLIALVLPQVPTIASSIGSFAILQVLPQVRTILPDIAAVIARIPHVLASVAMILSRVVLILSGIGWAGRLPECRQ